MSDGIERWGEIGTEGDWVEGVEEEPPIPQPEPETPAKPSPPAPDFHDEMLALMGRHGMEDCFYIVRAHEGKALRAWVVSVKPEDKSYRDRAAGIAFEAHGLLQHMEGTTW